MKLVPLGDRVIVEKIIPAEDKTEGGIILPGNAQQPFVQASVLAVNSDSKILKERDFVVVPRYAGTEVKHDGKLVCVMHEGDILFKVER